jgi:DNA-binding PadR family transcriptional regulator
MAVSVPMEVVKSKIFLIRGQKVFLDSDLAELYGVETRRLNEQVSRNRSRFPDDFMFQLNPQEFAGLISQTAISKPGRGGRRKMPYAFTEQGVAMLSSVLNSDRAVQVNIAIMRAFVQMRELATSNRELARKIDALEKKHAQHDQQFVAVFDAIRQMLEPVEKKRRKIGFGQGDEG